MRADMERFAIDRLIGDGQPPGRARRPPAFLVQVPELGSVGAHWHDYYELGYVLDGEADHVVNGVRGCLRPGTAFVLSPVDFHEVTVPAGRSLRCVNAVLEPAFVEDVLESVAPAADERLPWTGCDLGADRDDVRRMCAEASRRPVGWAVVVEAALRMLLVEMARIAGAGTGGTGATGPGAPGVPGGASPALRDAVRFVERHFREPLTLARVAAVAHLSPQWFSEQFRAATGRSFQGYLKNRRLQFARALLDATDLSVTDVCHASGFNDPSYFGRAYRARYGQAPSAQRR